MAVFTATESIGQPKQKAVDDSVIKARQSNYLRTGPYAKSKAAQPDEIATVVVKKPNSPWLSEDIPLTSLKNEDLVYAEVDDLYFVDLARITNDGSNVKKSKWLQANRAHIDLAATREYTVDAHRIFHPEDITGIYPSPKGPPATKWLKSTTLADIITAIDGQDIGTYANDAYHTYVEFSVDASGQLKAKKFSTFDGGALLFSVQMLKGLEQVHNLSGTSAIQIGEAIYRGHSFPFIYLEAAKRFYNYSNEPR